MKADAGINLVSLQGATELLDFAAANIATHLNQFVECKLFVHICIMLTY